MKFRCEKDVLVEAISTAARAVPSRGSGPASGGLRLETRGDRLVVLGSDAELAVEYTVEVNGLGDGTCMLPGRLLMDVVRSMPQGAVTVECDEYEARISAGRSQFSLRVAADVELPVPPQPGGSSVNTDGAELAEALRQVVRAASSDTDRLSLTGVLLASHGDGIRLVATDSYRLALRDLPGAEIFGSKGRLLLPARSLSELQRLLSSHDGSVEVSFGELDVWFSIGSVRLMSRVLNIEFPNYEKLIPTSCPNRLTVGKETILDALRRARLLVKDVTSSVKLRTSPTGLEVSASTAELGEVAEDIDASYDGEEMVLGFNPVFLMEGIEAAAGDEVVIEMQDSSKPVLIKSSESDQYLYVLMPIRIA